MGKKRAGSKMDKGEQKKTKRVENSSVKQNIVCFLRENQTGCFNARLYDRICRWAVVKQAVEYTAIRETMFNRRITALTWHPKEKYLIAAAAKNGEIELGKVGVPINKFKSICSLSQIGKGCAIYSVKFDPFCSDFLYTSCWNGTVSKRYFDCENDMEHLLKSDNDNWFTCLDVTRDGNIIVSSDTRGNFYIIPKENKNSVTKYKLHSKRILHVELCPRDNNLLVTTSLDYLVKLWDMRYLKDKASFIRVLQHNAAPQVATFSKTGGNKLLTSDQYREIRVYSAANWELLNTIQHPHRQFMHLTPIRASWHTTADIIVIGRYPDPNFPKYKPGEIRTVDFICPETGRIVHRLSRSLDSNNIASINEFDPSGTVLASATNSSLVFWSKFTIL